MSSIRALLIVAVMILGLVGCARNNNALWWVTDSETYSDLAGFSVKPPSGPNWSILPQNELLPNLISFMKFDVFPFMLESRYPEFNGTAATAYGTVLDEPVADRKNREMLAEALRNHLKHYQGYFGVTIKESVLDGSIGPDCLRFEGVPLKEVVDSDFGTVRVGDRKGYICLHPEHDNYAVILATQDGVRTGSWGGNRDQQVKNFYDSLRFTHISSAVKRSFGIKHHQVGKAPYQMAWQKGKIWAVLKDENRVVRLDPADGKITASVPVGRQPVSLSIGEGGVWVANSADGTVTRIEPESAAVVETITVKGRPVSVSAGRGGVWVADASNNSVVRIDPKSNTVMATIAAGKEPVSVFAGKDGIWTANAGDGTVTLIDPAHDWPIATIQVGGRPIRISLADTGAWVADEAGKAVIRIERKTRSVTARIALGDKPSWVAAIDKGDVFVALPGAAKILRIDPAQNRLFGPPIKATESPRAMMVLSGWLWVTNSAGTTLSQVNLNPFGQGIGSQSAL